jgi:NAD(P)H-dependent flavin oxidoreductase YrpB (nitropropane dioxygenase family)
MGSVALGQVCGRIDDIPTCQELIDRVVTEAERVLESLAPKITSLIPGVGPASRA